MIMGLIFMEMKIIVNTAKGSAKKVYPYLRRYLIGVRKSGISRYNCWSNDSDQIIIEVEGKVRGVMRIQKRVARFDSVFSQVMKNRKVRRVAGFVSDPTKEAEIDALLDNHTKMEIVKEATAGELDEHGKSFWVRMKEKFKKKD